MSHATSKTPPPLTKNLEKISGIVERVTFHNSENGWSVLKVTNFQDPGRLATVLVHQAKVFAGATMEFYGNWVNHPKHGHQFRAIEALEKKPATTAALEKYLGSGLIKGVGPVIAKKIVKHFQDHTLSVFEENIQRLREVPGIAHKKLKIIQDSWNEHRAIRDVMLFLQSYGISTLFAVKIYKIYGDRSISIVSDNPYCLARDIYGIGFFSADKIALKMGYARRGEARIESGIRHVLAASREQGHCYLTENQILTQTGELLQEPDLHSEIEMGLHRLQTKREIEVRLLESPCYYSKTLYFDELFVAKKIRAVARTTLRATEYMQGQVEKWIEWFCKKENLDLSTEQRAAVFGISTQMFSILTGGPGCGKTTTTRVVAQLLRSMKRRILLAAPTGRAAQRMTEVIGLEAKTIHRLLEWAPQNNQFKKNEQDPLDVDFLIVDECSMLDINLAASLLRAVPQKSQILFIGDPDQLPSVGAGNVLFDLLSCKNVSQFRLTQVFRQAEKSQIIRFAHEINKGVTPRIESPFARPKAFRDGIDCLFVDSDEITHEQSKFVHRVKSLSSSLLNELTDASFQDPFEAKPLNNSREDLFVLPERFQHVDLQRLFKTKDQIEELKEVLKFIHPWSSLHYGKSAIDTLIHLHTISLPEWLGKGQEIQVLTPQLRGTLGSVNLNVKLQEAKNPRAPGKFEIQLGDRIYRVGDRVIQTRNNYDLGVYNGDIGYIERVNVEEGSLQVNFGMGTEQRHIDFQREDLSELSLAYAITIHKSQGSEFSAVIIPIFSQHFNMLFRNLIYTGLTRAKKLAVFLGSRRALATAIGRADNRKRQTALAALISSLD